MSITKSTILIYTGSPLDYPEYRHTALHFTFPSGTTSTMHVVGTQGLFIFQEDVDLDPHDGGELAKAVPVAEIDGSVSAATIRRAVSATPVKNGRQDLDWNCQNWVGDALMMLVERGVLSAGDRDLAVDGMVEGCLEAGDQ
ncbi:hypothetical protein ETB97_006513 [Aspergillus alliaceus]|uniref:Uncharacterized protein n=1 Tax=Petromyces alliaceus TaxID=209559 RepID=A0A5N6FY69_PETAA|nr:uncharacterized protein BDW43DRAFT_311047 [Aspergillus alliaceus]KAB8233704.1 hypothetical protein BDW43DRAFT_311047 [Aspergillus alliaceus]KAE8396639.1 hypothetical protein BDV23DRAFT_177635 [Aspergillus alliaceus]KAF5856932.1 hypothetical protein ETB97_006513 [Aspergillus burnettii]